MKNVNEHVINDVVPGSLAEQAGIKVNDYLLEVLNSSCGFIHLYLIEKNVEILCECPE